MIRFDGVSFGYGPKPVLDGLTFQVKKGAFAAMIGANGAGKTTVARLCAGLSKPGKGRVSVGGKDTASDKASAFASFVGFVFQNPDRQICQNTVREEILFGLERIFPDAAARSRHCDEILETFALPGEKAPFTLSRGERQRTVLASIVARKPELLILDEPTTGLDDRESRRMMEIIRSLHRQGTTVFMISHDVELVLENAEALLVMNEGRLLGAGAVKELLFDADLLAGAAVLPPQIPALSLALGKDFPRITGVDAMAAALLAYGKEKERYAG